MSDAEIIQKHRTQGALIDANVLLVYVVGKLDRRRLRQFEHTKQYANDYPLIEKIVESFSKLFVTPNILTEVSNLGGKLKPPEPFFAKLSELISNQEHCQERYCKSVDAILIDAYRWLGLTDGSICKIAEQGILVVTADKELYHSLTRQGLEAINVFHLIQQAWTQ